jgi:hypothetical protein
MLQRSPKDSGWEVRVDGVFNNSPQYLARRALSFLMEQKREQYA